MSFNIDEIIILYLTVWNLSPMPIGCISRFQCVNDVHHRTRYPCRFKNCLCMSMKGAGVSSSSRLSRGNSKIETKLKWRSMSGTLFLSLFLVLLSHSRDQGCTSNRVSRFFFAAKSLSLSLSFFFDLFSLLLCDATSFSLSLPMKSLYLVSFLLIAHPFSHLRPAGFLEERELPLEAPRSM